MILKSKIPGMFRGSTEFVFSTSLPELIEIDGVQIASRLQFDVPAIPRKMIEKAIWYVENRNTHVHAFRMPDESIGYYILRKDSYGRYRKIEPRLLEMFNKACSGERDKRIKDLGHLAEVCTCLHVVNEEVEQWPVPRCELNPARLDCLSCKCFKSYGICSHVLAVNHILKYVNLRRELMEIGKSAAGRKGGDFKSVAPALERQKQREPDSSDEEEDRLLLLGEEGK